jgi:iron complex outermembrane recepter protein
MRTRLLLLLCITWFNAISVVYAQDTIKYKSVDELFNLSLDDFLNIVITPSKLPQLKSDVTQKIDLIDAEEIEMSISGNRNVCEVISKLPGASVSVLSRNDANWGTYGGIGPKYSTYMLQGVPIDAFIDPMSLDLNAIRHIEVQRGPASVIYPNYLSQDFAGSQSPLAGTINLILKDKIEQQKTIIQTSLGSYNTLNGQVFHQNKLNDLNYFLGSTFEMSDYINYGAEGSWLNMNKDPEYRKTKIYCGLTLFLDKREKQKLSVFLQGTWHKGDAGQVYREFENQYATVNVGYNIEVNTHIQFQSHLGIRSYDRTQQENSLELTDPLMSNTGVNQFIVPFDVSLSWIQGKAGSLSIGADYQGARYYTWVDSLNGYRTFGNKSSALQAGIYVQEEWRPIEKLTIRGGLRYAYIENTIVLVNGNNPDNTKLSWKKLQWSAGIRYTINEKLAVYSNGGSSYSTPGLKSIGGTIPLSDFGIIGRNGQLPNSNLNPEDGICIDAGIDCKLLNIFKLSIRGFYTLLQDGIIDNVVSRNPSQTQSINAQATSKGGEIEVSQRISSTITWYVNTTYITSNIRNKLNADQNNVSIPFAPNLIANIGATLKTTFGLILIPSLNYNRGFYDGISKTDRQWYTPGFILNTYIAQRLSKSDLCTVECFGQLYNITNNNYNMPWQFKNPGFSGMFGLKVTF